MEATHREISHFREIENRRIGIPIDKSLIFSMVKTTGLILVVRLTEAMHQEFSHFGKLGIARSGVLETRVRDFPRWKPWSSCGPSDLRR
jgi:hypothetical protein